jgi:hypothetical protein
MTAIPPLPSYLTFDFVTPEGDAFRIPLEWVPSAKTSRCRSCDAMIVWCMTPRQKRAPVNPDGTSHFASCPDADRWRKPKP